MKNPSNDWEELRRKVLGLGDDSVRKTHYLGLRQRLAELEQFRAKLKRLQILCQSILGKGESFTRLRNSIHELRPLSDVLGYLVQSTQCGTLHGNSSGNNFRNHYAIARRL